jgi:hypothetical protein
MDKITTDFVRATKKIYEQVSYILTELKLIGKDVKSIHEHKRPEGDEPESHESNPADSAIPPSRKTCKTYEAKQYALDKLRYRSENKAFCIGRWTVIILAIYTGLTGYQSCQAKRTADATVKAAEAAEHQINDTAANFRADQRAWIGIQSMALKLPEDPSEVIAAQAAMVNLGKSFALNVKSDFSLFFTVHAQDISEYVKREDRPSLATAGSLGNLPPNIPYPLNMVRQEPDLPPALARSNRRQVISQVNAGKYFIYLFGHIAYEDVFHQTHFTNFCGIWTPKVGSFDACPSYNDAD